MKIRALRLAEVGQFRDPIAVEGFSGGLDVLAGPNELGKSTLFRAIRAVLLTRHTTSGRIIDEMSTRGGARSPRIEADFEAQGQFWRITKTYGRGKSAELFDLETGRTRARGPDAEAMLGELIGIANTDAAAGRFGLLFVGQQKSLVAPTPDGDADNRKLYGGGERATLESCVAGEIDTVAGGVLSRRVADRVIAEIDTYLQPKRRLPKKGSRYDTAVVRRSRLIGERDRLRAEQEKAVARLDRFEELMQRQAGEAGAEQLDGLRRAKDGAEKSLLDAEKKANALAYARSREEAARLVHEQASERLQRFGKALDDVQAIARETAELADKHLLSEAALRQASDGISHFDDEITRIEARIARLACEADRARHAEALRSSIAGCEATLERANGLQREMSRIEALLAANPMTPERMRQLAQAAHAAVLAGERAARPAAVDLMFALDAAASGRVRINGEQAPASGRIGVAESVTLEICGIGRFEVIPADAAERTSLRVEAEAALSRLAAIETELDVRAGEAAQALADERQSLDEALTRAKAQLQVAAPEGVNALAEKIDSDRRALADLSCSVGGDEGCAAPDGTQVIEAGEPASGQAIDLEGMHRRLAAEAGCLRARREQLKDTLSKHKYDLRRIDERSAENSERLAASGQLLGPEAGRMGERDRLAAAHDSAEVAWNSILQERTLLSQSAPSAEQVRILQDMKAAADTALRQAEALAVRLAQEVAALDGEIRVAGEAEIGPEIARLDGEIAALDGEVAHYEHEVAALELLRDTLAAVAADNRTHFLQPVMRRLQPYLAQVFPGAEVVLGDDFGLQTLSRGGSGEPIDLLSDGTREQLAVLVRLGFGRLIAETGTPVPLILDDALVFSDDERIVRMFGALQSASQHHQVIVFTCREATFAPLGGTRLEVGPWQQRGA